MLGEPCPLSDLRAHHEADDRASRNDDADPSPTHAGRPSRLVVGALRKPYAIEEPSGKVPPARRLLESDWDRRVLLTLETRMMEHGNHRRAAEAAEVPRRAAPPGQVLRRWRAEILAHHRTGVQQRATEAANLLIKQVSDQGVAFVASPTTGCASCWPPRHEPARDS